MYLLYVYSATDDPLTFSETVKRNALKQHAMRTSSQTKYTKFSIFGQTFGARLTDDRSSQGDNRDKH